MKDALYTVDIETTNQTNEGHICWSTRPC